MVDSKYEIEIDLQEHNSSYYHLADLVGTGKKVLDVGCDTGYFGEALIARGNRCSGIEYVPETAEAARDRLDEVITGDLEQLDLVAELGEGIFDVVIFGDVLEHLRDPLPVLRSSRALLAPGGYVLISIPNIAHGDVRLALLDGRWEYTTTGLLDRTHTRFFTRSSLQDFLHDAGFALAELRRTRVPMFHSEQKVRREDYPADVVARIEADPECTTYQFVLMAVPRDIGFQAEHLAAENYELTSRVDQLTEAVAGRDHEIAVLRAEVDRLNAHAEHSTDGGAEPADPVSMRGRLARRLPRAAAAYRSLKGRP